MPDSDTKFTCDSASLPGGEIRFQFICNEVTVTFGRFYRLLVESRAFRDCVIHALAAVPFQSFFWECAPVSRQGLDQEFNCVVVNAPILLRRADSTAFAEYFNVDGSSIAVFKNLGNDALLVTPAPAGPDDWYGHLASFIRNADPAQVHALWHRVGKEMLNIVSIDPVWLSTSGAGISWLHVRLDSFPKYYVFKPFRVVGEGQGRI